MSVDQARQLPRTRFANEKRIGKRRATIVPVKVVDIDGNCITPVSEFKYLGTLVSNHGGSTGEIIRRIQIAASVFTHLKAIWGSTILSVALNYDFFLKL